MAEISRGVCRWPPAGQRGVGSRGGQAYRCAAQRFIALSIAMVDDDAGTTSASRGRCGTLVDDGSGHATHDAEAIWPMAIDVAGKTRRTDTTVRTVPELVAGAAAAAAATARSIPTPVTGTAAGPARAIPPANAATALTGARSDARRRRSNAST